MSHFYRIVKNHQVSSEDGQNFGWLHAIVWKRRIFKWPDRFEQKLSLRRGFLLNRKNQNFEQCLWNFVFPCDSSEQIEIFFLKPIEIFTKMFLLRFLGALMKNWQLLKNNKCKIYTEKIINHNFNAVYWRKKVELKERVYFDLEISALSSGPCKAGLGTSLKSWKKQTIILQIKNLN